MGQILRDRFGRRIGEIQTFGNSQVLRDSQGRKVGEFDGKITRDGYGRKIGEGNLLTTQLKKR